MPEYNIDRDNLQSATQAAQRFSSQKAVLTIFIGVGPDGSVRIDKRKELSPDDLLMFAQALRDLAEVLKADPLTENKNKPDADFKLFDLN